jgi:LysM repeat protein
MQNKLITIFLAIILPSVVNFSQAQTTDEVLAYIAKYKDIAIAEMQRTGVPASITLAQGIHETGAGTSDLVISSNNHFGIKCKADWTGATVFHDDDFRGECFRKYDDPTDSYKDHSDFLKNRSNYSSLFKIDELDYKAWAYGLKKAGYATNPKYPQILINLIETYNLQDYSLMALGKMKYDAPVVKDKELDEQKPVYASNTNKVEEEKTTAEETTTPVHYPSGEFKINETRVVFVKKGTSYLIIAEQYEIPLARLFDFNDMKQQEVAENDQLVYLQRKRKTGTNEFHVVQSGETLNTIAQTEAIRLDSLLEYNSLVNGMQPAVGEKLSLKTKSSFIPKLLSSTKVL